MITKGLAARQKAKGKRQKAKISEVERVLQGYADRGVFRAFSRTGTSFRFVWLWNLPFRATFAAGKLTFPAMLPNVAARSEVERGLKAFVKECASASRPEHRRINGRLVSWVRSKGALGVAIQVKDEAGVRHAVNLVSEMFTGYLNVEHAYYVMQELRGMED